MSSSSQAFLGGGLTTHARGRTLSAAFQASAPPTLPPAGALFVLGKDFQAAGDDTDSWIQWASTPGRVLIVVPPFGREPCDKPAPWEARTDRSPSTTREPHWFARSWTATSTVPCPRSAPRMRRRVGCASLRKRCRTPCGGSDTHEKGGLPREGGPPPRRGRRAGGLRRGSARVGRSPPSLPRRSGRECR